MNIKIKLSVSVEHDGEEMFVSRSSHEAHEKDFDWECAVGSAVRTALTALHGFNPDASMLDVMLNAAFLMERMEPLDRLRMARAAWTGGENWEDCYSLVIDPQKLGKGGDEEAIAEAERASTWGAAK